MAEPTPEMQQFLQQYVQGMGQAVPDAYAKQADTMDALFHDWGRSKIQAREIANHSLANLSYVNKMAVAKAQNLNPGERSQVTPFPSPTSINIESGNSELLEKVTEKLGQLAQQQTTTQGNTQTTEPMPYWKKLALAGTAGLALTVPPTAAYLYANRGTTDSEVVQPAGEGSVDMEIRRWTDSPTPIQE